MKKILSTKEIVEKELHGEDKFSGSFRAEFIYAGWSKIVGDVLSKKSEPVYIKSETLYVRVEGSAWIQQLNFFKKNIIFETNKLLNGSYIKNVIFFSDAVNKKRKEIYLENEQEIEEKIDSIPLENFEIMAIKGVISKIEDMELKKKFYRLMVKEKKKEKFLMEKGYKKCKKCGIVHNEKEELCTVCKNEKKREMEKRIYIMVNNNPYTSFQEAKVEFANIGEEEFKIIKQRAATKLYMKVQMLYREKKKEEAFKYAEKYFAIETGIRTKEIILKKIYSLFESFT